MTQLPPFSPTRWEYPQFAQTSFVISSSAIGRSRRHRLRGCRRGGPSLFGDHELSDSRQHSRGSRGREHRKARTPRLLFRDAVYGGAKPGGRLRRIAFELPRLGGLSDRAVEPQNVPGKVGDLIFQAYLYLPDVIRQGVESVRIGLSFGHALSLVALRILVDPFAELTHSSERLRP